MYLLQKKLEISLPPLFAPRYHSLYQYYNSKILITQFSIVLYTLDESVHRQVPEVSREVSDAGAVGGVGAGVVRLRRGRARRVARAGAGPAALLAARLRPAGTLPCRLRAAAAASAATQASGTVIPTLVEIVVSRDG